MIQVFGQRTLTLAPAVSVEPQSLPGSFNWNTMTYEVASSVGRCWEVLPVQERRSWIDRDFHPGCCPPLSKIIDEEYNLVSWADTSRYIYMLSVHLFHRVQFPCADANLKFARFQDGPSMSQSWGQHQACRCVYRLRFMSWSWCWFIGGRLLTT